MNICMRYLNVLNCLGVCPESPPSNHSHPICFVISASRCSEALVAMGYNRQDIEASLSQVRYDDVFATYLLLGRKSTDVSTKKAESIQVVCVC